MAAATYLFDSMLWSVLGLVIGYLLGYLHAHRRHR